MLTARVHAYGGIDSAVVDDVEDPTAPGDAVLVDVLTVGLSAYDLLILRKKYRDTHPNPADRSLRQLGQLVASKQLSSNVANSDSLVDVQEAFASVSNHPQVGKTVVPMPAAEGRKVPAERRIRST